MHRSAKSVQVWRIPNNCICLAYVHAITISFELSSVEIASAEIGARSMLAQNAGTEIGHLFSTDRKLVECLDRASLEGANAEC